MTEEAEIALWSKYRLFPFVLHQRVVSNATLLTASKFMVDFLFQDGGG
jgi:hypothetical protein